MPVLIYIVCADRDQAHRLGRTLVEERLAACANILPGMRSVYRWQDRIEESDEAVLLLKSEADLVERLSARVRTLHSYQVPCVLALPIMGGDPDYLAWVAHNCG